MNGNDDISWDLARLNSNYNNLSLVADSIEEILVDHSKRIADGFFAGLIGGKYTYSIAEYIATLVETNIVSRYPHTTKIDLPFYSRLEIQKKVESCFIEKSIERKVNYQFSFETLIRKYLEDIELIDDCDLGLDKFGNRIIGKLRRNKIYTYDKINFNDARWNFTVAHELAHFCLHSDSDWFISYSESHDDIDLSSKYVQIDTKQIKNIEYQANIFAAELLLPDSLVDELMKELIIEERLVNRGFGYIYLDEQKINIDLFHKVALRFRQKIAVSNAVVEIKLKELGYLTRTKSTRKELLDRTISRILDHNKERI